MTDAERAEREHVVRRTMHIAMVQAHFTAVKASMISVSDMLRKIAERDGDFAGRVAGVLLRHQMPFLDAMDTFLTDEVAELKQRIEEAR